MNDNFFEVRDNACETLCKIKSLFGVEALGNIDEWRWILKDQILKIKN